MRYTLVPIAKAHEFVRARLRRLYGGSYDGSPQPVDTPDGFMFALGAFYGDLLGETEVPQLNGPGVMILDSCGWFVDAGPDLYEDPDSPSGEIWTFVGVHGEGLLYDIRGPRAQSFMVSDYDFELPTVLRERLDHLLIPILTEELESLGFLESGS